MTCQAHPALVKRVQCTVRSFYLTRAVFSCIHFLLTYWTWEYAAKSKMMMLPWMCPNQWQACLKWYLPQKNVKNESAIGPSNDFMDMFPNLVKAIFHDLYKNRSGEIRNNFIIAHKSLVRFWKSDGSIKFTSQMHVYYKMLLLSNFQLVSNLVRK